MSCQGKQIITISGCMENYDTIKIILISIGFIAFMLWINKRQMKASERTNDTKEQQLNHAQSQNKPLSTEDKLNYICQTLDQIRWIGLSIALMFALTFVIPQCTG
jgi:hypothetical protein